MSNEHQRLEELYRRWSHRSWFCINVAGSEICSSRNIRLESACQSSPSSQEEHSFSRLETKELLYDFYEPSASMLEKSDKRSHTSFLRTDMAVDFESTRWKTNTSASNG